MAQFPDSSGNARTALVCGLHANGTAAGVMSWGLCHHCPPGPLCKAVLDPGEGLRGHGGVLSGLGLPAAPPVWNGVE